MPVIMLIVVVIIVICFYFSFDSRKYPPGPWNLPLIGYLYKLDKKTPNLDLMQLAEKYGPIYTIKLGLTNTVVIAEAKLLKKVLLKDQVLARPPLLTFQMMFGEKGLTCCWPLHMWKNQRKFVADFLRTVGATKTATNKSTLEQLIRKSAENFVQDIHSRGDRTLLDPSEAVGNYVSTIVHTLLLGTSFSRDENTQIDLSSNIDDVSKMTFCSRLNFLPFAQFLPQYRKMKNVFKQTMEKIRHTQEKFVNTGVSNFSKNNTSLIDTFLTEMARNGSDEIYNAEQLKQLLFDLFAASTETTVHSIRWLLLYLARYQEVQSKVRRELLQVLQGEPPDTGDLAKLGYMKATIAEIARIRTLVPLGFPRYATEDFCVDNMTIKKDSLIIPLLWAIHMDPKVWEKPEEFSPDRFLDGEGKFCKHESLVPFQAGKRMCVGKHLANMMMFQFVATVLQKVKIECCGSGPVDFSYECGLSLLPKPQKLVFVKI
ncbi:cytochrome P450 306a1-like [Zophobas morio]|uniref:cytochrome P450 306a1-like n=1 Tax=Zophobas morio TaxID=2755281 RepID=UPI0030828B6B